MAGFRKTNHPAIAGFLLPFLAAGATAVLVLTGKGSFQSLAFTLAYLILVPAVLLAGLICSLKAIPLIPERNDKDYVYSGLTLNLLFTAAYILSLFYFFPSLLK